MSERWPAANMVDLVEMCLNPTPSVCETNLDKTSFSSFMVSLFYCFWKFCNECFFEGKNPIKGVGIHLN